MMMLFDCALIFLRESLCHVACILSMSDFSTTRMFTFLPVCACGAKWYIYIWRNLVCENEAETKKRITQASVHSTDM